METNDHALEGYVIATKNRSLMNKLEVATIVTMIMGVLSVMAILFTYMALCDIGHKEPDVTLEWNIVGIGLLIWILFIVSALVTVTYVFKLLIE